ncbi:MAG TPA: preprotein translocase subunit SecE [Caulobacteraceae bacterium]|jgi:preprotein translocase subunit SecE|nr:preprotein translocase subunit SecE [Caulobacteraceae bacterium]
MAKDRGVNMPTAQGSKGAGRTIVPAKPSAMAAAAPVAPKRRTSPAQFVKEVRAEVRKIHWTSWKETWITSVMVFIMVVMTALFLRVVDIVLGFGIQQLLKLAS